MSSIEVMDCEGQVEILEIPKTLEKNVIVMFQSEDFQLFLLNNVGFIRDGTQHYLYIGRMFCDSVMCR